MSRKEKKDKDFVHRAYYEGGSTAMSKFISSNMRYPEEAQKKGIQGTVKLRFDIDHKGKVHHVKVISGIGSGCDEEAIRIAELLEFKVPKTHKLKVGFKKKLNIHFKLKKVAKPKVEKRKTSVKYNYVSSTKTTSGYNYTIKI